MTEGARIVVRRDQHWLAAARAFKVIVDGDVVGRVRNGGTEVFEVPAGDHSLRIRLDLAKSNELEFELLPAERATFSCRPAPWDVLLWPYRLIRRRPSLVVLPSPGPPVSENELPPYDSGTHAR